MTIDLLIIVGGVLGVLLIWKFKVSKKISLLVFLSVAISGGLVGSALLYFIMALLNYSPNVGEESSGVDNLIRIAIPLIASIITALSLVIASYNTSNNDYSNKRQSVLDFIKFTNDIIRNEKTLKESEELLKNTENNLKNIDTKIDILVNRGARFTFNYLTVNNEENRNTILQKLSKLNYEPGSTYDIEKKELVSLIKSDDIKDMRSLWIIVNQLSGTPSVRFKVLTDKKVYKLNNHWIGRGLRRHAFYTDTIFKRDRHILSDMIKKNAEEDYNTYLLTYDDVFRVVNTTFSKSSKELGHLFRTFHRTLKLINQNFRYDEDEYKQQIGLLRAQVPDSIAYLIFLNAFYTERGRGMALELLNADFWGDEKDFKFVEDEKDMKGRLSLVSSQHFNGSSMNLYNQNGYIINKLFTNNKENEDLLKEIMLIKNKKSMIFHAGKFSLMKLKNFLWKSPSRVSYLKQELDDENEVASKLIKEFRHVFIENSYNFVDKFKLWY